MPNHLLENCLRPKTELRIGFQEQVGQVPEYTPIQAETFTLPCLFDPQAQRLESGFAQDTGACLAKQVADTSKDIESGNYECLEATGAYNCIQSSDNL